MQLGLPFQNVSGKSYKQGADKSNLKGSIPAAEGQDINVWVFPAGIS